MWWMWNQRHAYQASSNLHVKPRLKGHGKLKAFRCTCCGVYRTAGKPTPGIFSYTVNYHLCHLSKFSFPMSRDYETCAIPYSYAPLTAVHRNPLEIFGQGRRHSCNLLPPWWGWRGGGRRVHLGFVKLPYNNLQKLLCMSENVPGH